MAKHGIFTDADEMVMATIVRSASHDAAEARAAQYEMAKALESVIRKGELPGDVHNGIFETINLGPNAAPEFQLDIVAPGMEKEHVAYTIPSQGRIPERCVEGDYIMLPTFEVGSSIDWPLKLARNARTDVVNRAMEVFYAGFVKKNNDDAWKVLLAAAAARNLVVFDQNAGQGRFTLRLISLMDQAMRRLAGGNGTSLWRGRVTDLYLSVEALELMRDWTVAEVPEALRNAIINSEDGFVTKLFRTRLHDMTEFGVGQEYQNFFLDPAGINGELPAGDVEIMVGLDLQRNDSFVHPVRQKLEVFVDDNLHRQRRAGVYGWAEHGWGVLDNRRVILGSI